VHRARQRLQDAPGGGSARVPAWRLVTRIGTAGGIAGAPADGSSAFRPLEC
jgi:hypothetical protein